jgi:Protein of unknown function (DUF4235)
MKLIYKPFGLIAGLLAGLVAQKIFEFLWGRVDDQEPPKSKTRDAPLGKVLGAAALQGAVFRSVKAYVDREGARGFEHLTGVWPGEQEPGRAGRG